MILAGDIGGTKSYVGLFDWKDQRVEPIREEKFWNADFGSFEELLTEFLEDLEKSYGSPGQEDPAEDSAQENPPPLKPITAACFGVPGPVIDNRCQTTNLPWVIDGTSLQKLSQSPKVQLLNDLEAMAYGLQVLRSDETMLLNAGGKEHPQGTKALIAAGTGLGEAILFWDGQRYRSCPSEGGHASFAPISDREIDLLRYLRTSYRHVSFERVLSGEGLHLIYQFLRDTQKNEPTWFAQELPNGDPAALIAEAALKGKPDICVQALDLFISVFGGETGNLALKSLALGGIYIGGGIAPKILPKLKHDTFMKAFTAKGRYQRLLNTIPVRVILNDQAGLLGAASYAAESALSH
ncbi:MAG: glucokinase [Nitrospirales bacterium]|nr:glucokinase [Nitrospirales bacterium]